MLSRRAVTSVKRGATSQFTRIDRFLTPAVADWTAIVQVCLQDEVAFTLVIPSARVQASAGYENRWGQLTEIPIASEYAEYPEYRKYPKEFSTDIKYGAELL